MNQSNEVLSIQLSLNGLYFSVSLNNQIQNTGFIAYRQCDTEVNGVLDALQQGNVFCRQYSQVKVIIDSDKSVVVPAEFLTVQNAASFLEMNGIAIACGEIVVCSESVNNIRCAMVVSNQIHDELSTRYGEIVKYYSHIQANLSRLKKSCIDINLADFAYITLMDRTLQQVQILPCDTLADILYYVESLAQRFIIRNFSIVVSGKDSKACAKLLKKYYKGVSHKKRGIICV